MIFYIIIYVFAIFAFSSTVSACGPNFPDSFIEADGGTAYPKMDFSQELIIIAAQYMPEIKFFHEFTPTSLSTADADIKDFTELLNSPELMKILGTDERRNSLIIEYAKFANASRKGEQIKFDFNVSDELKFYIDEFFLYLNGIRILNEKLGCTEIPEPWTNLLSLPKKQRKYRSSWVLYMIANLHSAAGRSKQAHDAYESLRVAVTEGYVDTCGLAFASFKRDYICEKNLKEKIKYGLKALAYYGKLVDIGAEESYCFLIEDLFYVTQSVFESKKLIGELFEDDICAEILLARRLSGYCWRTTVLDDKDINQLFENRKTIQGDRIAYTAFYWGDIRTAEKWLKKNPKDSLLSIWLRAEIARREKNYDEAARQYKVWLNIFRKADNNGEIKRTNTISFHSNYNYRDSQGRSFDEELYGKLGTVSIHRRDFMEALHCFMKAHSWVDAAYLAESVLDSNELKAYVDAYQGCRQMFFRSDADYQEFLRESKESNDDSTDIYGQLRWLLARRMMREKDYVNALKYMPEKLAIKARLLIKFIVSGNDENLDVDERGLAKYNAGKIMRQYGLSLCGTEHAPDSHYTEGNYEYKIVPNIDMPMELIAMEEARRPDKPKRFHYRYVAAEMMWNAAELAKSDNLKALALYVGGRYLAIRDPQLAEPFYKKLALMHNCRLTKEADRTCWFPKKFSAGLENEVNNSTPIESLEQVAEIIFSTRTFIDE